MSGFSNVLADDSGIIERRRIAIVDAHHDSTDILDALLRHLGSETAIAHDAADAVAMVRSFRPHVVMIDLRARGESAYRLAATLREEYGPDDLLLIAVDAWGTKVLWKRVADAGFDYHLHKPYAMEELEEIIEAARSLPRWHGVSLQPTDDDTGIKSPCGPLSAAMLRKCNRRTIKRSGKSFSH